MKEKYEKTINFEDVTQEAIEALVAFMYTEEITLTEENVSDILHAASMLRVVGKIWQTGFTFYVVYNSVTAILVMLFHKAMFLPTRQ